MVSPLFVGKEEFQLTVQPGNSVSNEYQGNLKKWVFFKYLVSMVMFG